MLTPQQPENSNFCSSRISKPAQPNRKTTAVVLSMVVLVLLAIAVLLPPGSSAVDSTAPDRVELSDGAAMPRSGSATIHRGDSGRREPGTSKDAAPISSATMASLIPEPLQTAGKQVIVNFDDVPSLTNVGGRYPNVVFSSANRTIEARSNWGGSCLIEGSGRMVFTSM